MSTSRLVLLASFGSVFASSQAAQDPIEVQDVPRWRGRHGHGLALDPDRGRVVLFGDDRTDNRDPIWEWDGTRWSYVRPRGPAPNRRYDQGMAFDPVSRRILMFGGYDGYFTLFDDTWAWDGRAWTRLAPANHPPARWGHSMVTDEARGRIVLFGGSPTAGWGGGTNDTWEWDGHDWRQVSTVQSPAPRTGQAMAYDRQARVVVMNGGWPGVVPFGDTWAYDGVAWQLISPGDPRLTPRVGHDMATEVLSGRPVLYGGHEGQGTFLNDTWTWDGSVWQPRTSAPSLHGAGRMASDGRRVVLFGGSNPQPAPHHDTWGWDGTAWSLLDDPGFLGVLSGTFGLTAFHRRLESFVVGDMSANQPPVFQILGNDGLLRHAGAVPPNGLGHIAYDVARDRLIGLDQAFQTAWSWDGQTWTRLPDPPAMVYPSTSWWEPRQRCLSFLQSRSASVVDWDGTAWSVRSIAGVPMTRDYVAVGYDPARDRLVAYGGQFQTTFYRETWEWDGANWTLKDSGGPVRRGWALAYGGERVGMLLFSSTYPQRPEIWNWDGATWRVLSPVGVRTAGAVSHVAVDPGRSRLLVSYQAIEVAYPSLDEISLAPLAADQPYPRLGESVTLSVELPSEGGNALAVGLSTAVDPGIPIRPNTSGTWDLFPVAATPLLFASLQTAPIDAGGKASVRYAIPVNRALWWMRLYGAGIVVRPGPALGTITNTARLWVVQ